MPTIQRIDLRAGFRRLQRAGRAQPGTPAEHDRRRAAQHGQQNCPGELADEVDRCPRCGRNRADRRGAVSTGRSLRLRQVSAGGCNGCEVEANALGNAVFDAGRCGIEFVASPRHADGLLVTGPVTENMREALIMTYEAVAEPKLVIAAGACAISGGLYRGDDEVCGGIEGLVPVDLSVPGCPPRPVTILDGLLRLLGHSTPSSTA